jgi:hypothetical protein
MKTLPLLLLLSFFVTCQKAPDLIHPPITQEGTVQNRPNSIWPLEIYLGEDFTTRRTDSVNIENARAFIPFCGVSPEYEVPVWGTEVYQISGPNQSRVHWGSGGLSMGGLVPGNYTYIGHAYMIGYSRCDSFEYNDHAYDTLNITVLKSKRKIK